MHFHLMWHLLYTINFLLIFNLTVSFKMFFSSFRVTQCLDISAVNVTSSAALQFLQIASAKSRYQ